MTKARILEAVREVKGEQATQLIDRLKKGEMAERAQELLAGSGWLPEPLRTPGAATTVTSRTAETVSDSPIDATSEESATTGHETAIGDSGRLAEDEPLAIDPHAVAAE